MNADDLYGYRMLCAYGDYIFLQESRYSADGEDGIMPRSTRKYIYAQVGRTGKEIKESDTYKGYPQTFMDEIEVYDWNGMFIDNYQTDVLSLPSQSLLTTVICTPCQWISIPGRGWLCDMSWYRRFEIVGKDTIFALPL